MGAKRARGRIPRRKKDKETNEAVRDEILVSVIREDLGPEPLTGAGPDSPWLVTVIFQQSRGGGGFLCKCFHPETSVECSLRVPAIECAQTPMPPLAWAATVLPTALEMYRIHEQPRLRLGAKLALPASSSRRRSTISMIDNYSAK